MRNNFLNNKSLSSQISLVLLGVFLLASTAFAWWFSLKLTQSNKEVIINEYIAISKTLSANLVNYISRDNFVAMENLLITSSEFEQIHSIIVTNINRQIISEVVRNPEGVLAPTFSTRIVSFPQALDKVISHSDDIIDFRQPIVLGSKQYGWVIVKLDATFLSELRTSNIITIGVASLFILGFSVIAIFMFLKPRLASLDYATKFASKLPTHFGENINEKLGSAELNSLAKALNFSSTKLYAQEAKLKENSDLLKKSNNQLRERVKELNGIYTTTEILNDPYTLLSDKLQKIADLIPPAWQYPELTSARVRFLNTSFVSKNFKTSKNKLIENITIDNKNIGSIEVFYSELSYDLGENFLEEEVNLLREIANSLAKFLRQHQIQKELEHMNETLEHKVAERTEKFNQAILEAEKANNAKTEFLSRMSHELRTPMNAVMGFATLLQMDKSAQLSEKQLKNVQHIIDASDHLMTLINEVLEISRIEEGKLTLDMRAAQPELIIEDLLPLLEPLAKEKNIEIELVGPKVHKEQVMLDVARFKQIIINLVSNAIKYNITGGSIEIRCEINKTNHLFNIQIRDTGVGIDPKDYGVIFDPFERLPSSRLEQGSGIGLTIVKLLVDHMDGDIAVESQVGKGSTFSLSFPTVAIAEEANV